jgi:D-arabinose 1-dehydrogenase-like Zn-dependent alcohol dehydrogenase
VTLGHEVAGTVEALGVGVPSSVTVGQRVLLQARQSCGQCASCLRRRPPCLRGRTRGVNYDGGWAQYALARHDTLVPIPDDLPFDQAAIIPDAVSTPYAAIVTTAGVRPAQSVGVWGAGGLGTHGVQLLRLAGAAPIIASTRFPVPASGRSTSARTWRSTQARRDSSLRFWLKPAGLAWTSRVRLRGRRPGP